MHLSGKESASIDIVCDGSLDKSTLERRAFTEYFVTASVSDSPMKIFDRVAEFAKSQDAAIIQQYVFGGCKYYQEGMKALKKACGEIRWPVTWIQGDPCNGEDLTATQIYAVKGNTEPVVFNGKIVGTLYEDQDASYCLLGDLTPDDLNASPGDQTTAVFEKMQAVLQTAGMDFSNVVRTWMYLSDLLKWYDEFNVARTGFFEKYGVFDRMVPASTGIGVKNPDGAYLVTDVYAVKPKTDKVSIREVESPLQCSATDYKSSFSRAVEVALPDHRTILVSGTASIEPGGKTIHVGDVKKQIDLSMEVVEAILKTEGMDWTDVVRGIAYFKDIKNVPLYTKYCDDHNIAKMPIALSHSDICRDDLLFEIEVDAVQVTK